MTNEIVIVAAKRTALGSFGGSLKSVSAVQLGETVCKNILSESKLDPALIDEVIFGNVLHAGLGQNVARQIAVNSGIPVQVPAFTIDMVCGSGLKAVELGVQKIKCGDAQVVLAGGTENMSQAPYVLEKHRWGSRMGNDTVVDTMIKDGLSDAFKGYHMGITAENVAEKYGLSREEQDQFAYESQQKAVAAIKAGKFVDEIVPVEVATRKETFTFDTDEYPRESTTPEKLAHLRPAFKPEGGTVTAGNASGLNDGAAAVLLMTREKAKELDLPILATVVSCASAGVDPSVMGCGPIPASQKALAKAQLSIEDMNLVEANEAFASQALAVMRDLKLDPNIVNVNGGAIALGHPIGASGARILVTLIHEMMKRESEYGLATLCIGGGQGEAVVIKRGEEN